MTDQELKDLNEKLLRFAGFLKCDVDTEGTGLYIAPDGAKYDGPNLPDVPDFLDPDWGIAYQVRWIWPRLEPIQIHFKKHSSYPEHRNDINCWFYLKGKQYEGWSNINPAVAAAKAVEQLIDSLDEKENPPQLNETERLYLNFRRNVRWQD